MSNTPFCLNASGHLPVKLPDYNNRLRVLVATYVTFSPDGTELLVNMGGEQVMLVGTNKGWREKLLISILLPKLLLFFCARFFQVYLFDLTFKQRPYTFLLPKKCQSSTGRSVSAIPTKDLEKVVG